MFRPSFAFPAISAFLVCASPALAATLPLADLSCKQFTGYNKENTGVILNWLDGFYADRDAPPVIDFDRMGENGKKLEQYCVDHPDTSVGKAVQQIMDK